MKRTVRIMLPIVILAMAVLVILKFRVDSAEPRYEGEPLSFWLVSLVSDYPLTNQDAVRAIRAMGEPAVRRLTEMVEREDSFLTKQLIEQSDNIPALANIVTTRYWDRYLAARALGEIGTNAAPAIPALEKMSKDPDEALAATAVAALVLVRNEPIDTYIAEYLSYTNRIYPDAFRVLCALGPHANEAIPSLLQELESSDVRIRYQAILVLGTVGIGSELCFNTLTNLLNDPESLVQSGAVNALANYGPQAKPATPLVAALLDDADENCQTSALMFFWRVLTPEEFVPYQSRIEQMTNSSSATVAEVAEIILSDISAED